MVFGARLVVGHEVAQFLGGDVLALVLVADGFDLGCVRSSFFLAMITTSAVVADWLIDRRG